MPPISRRAFLAATGGLVIAAACGDSGNGVRSGAAGSYVGLRVAIDQYATTRTQRFAFAVTKDDRFFAGPEATIAFRAPTDEVSDRQPTTLRAEGLPENRGIYDTEGVFEQAGVWFGEIEIEGQPVELPFQVNPLPETLVAGDPAHRAPSPTPSEPLGVDPICTRDPVCGLHTRSLGELVGAGRPVAVMFATPARCETQYCGPVLDMLLDEQGPFADRVDFVHVEIYRGYEGEAVVPTVEAWTLPSEPWLFGIDGAGDVTERLGGAFDRGEVRELLGRLAG